MMMMIQNLMRENDDKLHLLTLELKEVADEISIKFKQLKNLNDTVAFNTTIAEIFYLQTKEKGIIAVMLLILGKERSDVLESLLTNYQEND